MGWGWGGVVLARCLGSCRVGRRACGRAPCPVVAAGAAACECQPATCLPSFMHPPWRGARAEKTENKVNTPVAGWRTARLPSTRLLSYRRPYSSAQAGAGAVPSRGARLLAAAEPLPASRASCRLSTRRESRWEEGHANWNAPCTCASAPARCALATRPLRAAQAPPRGTAALSSVAVERAVLGFQFSGVPGAEAGKLEYSRESSVNERCGDASARLKGRAGKRAGTRTGVK